MFETIFEIIKVGLFVAPANFAVVMCAIVGGPIWFVLNMLDKKRQRAQYQARIQKHFPDGFPPGKWYIDNGRRYYLNWWNVPVIDL